jgi:hypothetical protein
MAPTESIVTNFAHPIDYVADVCEKEIYDHSHGPASIEAGKELAGDVAVGGAMGTAYLLDKELEPLHAVELPGASDFKGIVEDHESAIHDYGREHFGDQGLALHTTLETGKCLEDHVEQAVHTEYTGFLDGFLDTLESLPATISQEYHQIFDHPQSASMPESNSTPIVPESHIDITPQYEYGETSPVDPIDPPPMSWFSPPVTSTPDLFHTDYSTPSEPPSDYHSGFDSSSHQDSSPTFGNDFGGGNHDGGFGSTDSVA